MPCIQRHRPPIFVMAYVWGMLRGETSCAASGVPAIATAMAAMAAMAPRRSEYIVEDDLLGEVTRVVGRGRS